MKKSELSLRVTRLLPDFLRIPLEKRQISSLQKRVARSFDILEASMEQLAETNEKMEKLMKQRENSTLR